MADGENGKASAEPTSEMPPTETAEKKKRGVRQSARAGLQLPVGRVRAKLRADGLARKISEKSAVYLTAVMEYMAAELFEIAGNEAKSAGAKRVNPQHLNLAIRNDEELSSFFGRSTFQNGGVVPRHRPEIVPRRLRDAKTKRLEASAAKA